MEGTTPPGGLDDKQELKHHCTSGPVPQVAISTKPYIFQSDASDQSTGAVLSQHDQGEEEHPVASVSHPAQGD